MFETSFNSNPSVLVASPSELLDRLGLFHYRQVRKCFAWIYEDIQIAQTEDSVITSLTLIWLSVDACVIWSFNKVKYDSVEIKDTK